jgi:transposase
VNARIQKARGSFSKLRRVWLSKSLQKDTKIRIFNPLSPELNPICYLLALLAHHFLHVSRIRVKSLTLRLLMSYIYGAHILDVSRSHTTTQHSR